MKQSLRFRLNPIIVKELRSRMRGGRAFAILTGMLLFLSGALYGLYQLTLTTASYTMLLSPNLGQTLFVGLVMLEMLIICFVTPAVTSGAISGEREKLTYEMLLTTPLPPTSILWGKLISALSYVLLLIFAAIPLASLVFIFGGVAPLDMLKALVVLITVAIMFGVVGIFMSAWLGRTARATVLSYLIVLILIVAPVALYILMGILRQNAPPRWILVPNPISMLFSAIMPSLPGQGPSGLVQGLGMALAGNIDLLQGTTAGVARPLYHYSLPLYAGITLVLYLLSAQMVKPVRRWRVSWVGAAATLAIVLVLSGGTAFAFLSTMGGYEQASALPTPVPGRPVPAMPVAVAERAVAVRAAPPAPTATPPQSAALDVEAASAIYTALIRGLPTDEEALASLDSSEQAIYLAQTTDDVVGYADAPLAPAQVLPEAVQAALEAQFPQEVQWIEAWSPDTAAETGLADDDLVLVLGNVHLLDEDAALVAVTLHFADGTHSGSTRMLQQENGAWQLTGDKRASWGD